MIEAISPTALVLRFTPGAEPPPLDPVHILAGLPRPQTARRILADATSLGVASIRFFRSEKGEPGYATSTLWTSGEWRRRLIEGAAQAFDTRLPEVAHHAGLSEALAALPTGCLGIALDNYEAPARLAPVRSTGPLALAFGAERGWSAAERALLLAGGFSIAHMGPRVLRTETAIVSAIAVAKACA